jgi:hypothetical protein
MGELILTKVSTYKTTEVDLSNQANGVYFIKINSKNKSITTKIIKQ